jgi:hypothetical protein
MPVKVFKLQNQKEFWNPVRNWKFQIAKFKVTAMSPLVEIKKKFTSATSYKRKGRVYGYASHIKDTREKGT